MAVFLKRGKQILVITKQEWYKSSDVDDVTTAESFIFYTIVMFILKPLCVALLRVLNLRGGGEGEDSGDLRRHLPWVVPPKMSQKQQGPRQFPKRHSWSNIIDTHRTFSRGERPILIPFCLVPLSYCQCLNMEFIFKIKLKRINLLSLFFSIIQYFFYIFSSTFPSLSAYDTYAGCNSHSYGILKFLLKFVLSFSN